MIPQHHIMFRFVLFCKKMEKRRRRKQWQFFFHHPNKGEDVERWRRAAAATAWKDNISWFTLMYWQIIPYESINHDLYNRSALLLLRTNILFSQLFRNKMLVHKNLILLHMQPLSTKTRKLQKETCFGCHHHHNKQPTKARSCSLTKIECVHNLLLLLFIYLQQRINLGFCGIVRLQTESFLCREVWKVFIYIPTNKPSQKKDTFNKLRYNKLE